MGSTTSSEFNENRLIYTKYARDVYQDIVISVPELEKAAKVYYLYSVVDNFIHLSCSRKHIGKN